MPKRYLKSAFGKLHLFLVTYGIGLVFVLAAWEYGSFRKETFIIGMFAWVPGVIFYLKSKFSVLKDGHPLLSHHKVMDEENSKHRKLSFFLLLVGFLLTWKLNIDWFAY